MAVRRGESPNLAGARQLVRDARVARALREVAGALGASLELDELLELVVKKLVGLLDVERVVLFLHDERSRELVSRTAASDADYSLRFPLREGLLGVVARTGQGVRVASLAASDLKPEWEPSSLPGADAALVVPLKNNLGRNIGVLLVSDRRTEEPFSEDDEEILAVLAQQAAIAIDNSRLLLTLIRKNQQLQQAQVQLTRRLRDLELLFELERRTAHAVSLEDLARAVLESLSRACDASGAVLVLSEAEEGFIEFRLTRNLRASGEEPEFLLYTGPYSPMDSAVGSVIEHRAPIQLDVAVHPLTHAGLPEVGSMIAEPLEGGDTPLGALALVNKRGGPFTAEDLGLLRLVSANVSTAVRLFSTSRSREREERLTSIGRLLSQVVHDLKSPLTVISGYVQLMEESSSKKERSHFAEEILKQFQALGAMQQEVLAFARGETRVFARRVIVDQFLVSLRAQLEAELRQSGVDLRVGSAPKTTAYFDAERITRALQNLVRNAAEAMAGAGGTVTVSAEDTGDALTFRVSDTGPGIPPEIRPRLFQSFVTSGKKHGTGLGLAIVKRIVEEHGGTIVLADVPRGACFVMRLPQRPASARLGVPASAELGQSEVARKARTPRLDKGRVASRPRAVPSLVRPASSSAAAREKAAPRKKPGAAEKSKRKPAAVARPPRPPRPPGGRSKRR